MSFVVHDEGKWLAGERDGLDNGAVEKIAPVL